jgi:hypothetical protein
VAILELIIETISAEAVSGIILQWTTAAHPDTLEGNTEPQFQSRLHSNVYGFGLWFWIRRFKHFLHCVCVMAASRFCELLHRLSHRRQPIWGDHKGAWKHIVLCIT